jgi:hypothetical protein
MKNIEPEKKEDPLESLIRGEENAALARFRSEDFESHVRRRIAAVSPEEKARPLGRMLARPVRVAVAGGILVIAVGIALLRRPAPKPDLARSIEGILRMGPRIEVLEPGSLARARIPDATAAAPDANNLAALIAGGMSSGAARSAERADAVPRRFSGARPLSLEEIYRIVSVDKSIERVLMLVS